MDEYQRLLDLPPFEKSDLVLVLVLAVVSGIFSETISYFLLYKRGDYRKKHNEAIELYEQIATFSFTKADSSPKKEDKNSRSEETELQVKYLKRMKELKDLKLLSTLITGLTFMILIPIIMGIFDASPAGKAPFVPFSFFLIATKSDLPGTDNTDVSPAFLYTLTLMCTKNNIKAFFGFNPPGGVLGEMLLKSKVQQKGISV